MKYHTPLCGHFPTEFKNAQRSFQQLASQGHTDPLRVGRVGLEAEPQSGARERQRIWSAAVLVLGALGRCSLGLGSWGGSGGDLPPSHLLSLWWAQLSDSTLQQDQAHLREFKTLSISGVQTSSLLRALGRQAQGRGRGNAVDVLFLPSPPCTGSTFGPSTGGELPVGRPWVCLSACSIKSRPVLKLLGLLARWQVCIPRRSVWLLLSPLELFSWRERGGRGAAQVLPAGPPPPRCGPAETLRPRTQRARARRGAGTRRPAARPRHKARTGLAASGACPGPRPPRGLSGPREGPSFLTAPGRGRAACRGLPLGAGDTLCQGSWGPGLGSAPPSKADLGLDCSPPPGRLVSRAVSQGHSPPT